MSDLESIMKRNAELARQINEEARANPNSPYAGKFVGIANGRVVTVGTNRDEVGRALEQIEPEPLGSFVVEASRDYDEVIEIWSCR